MAGITVMDIETLVANIEGALAELPVIDVHTHLIGGKLSARGLHDIMLYHMLVADMYSAGCPSGARLSQFPSWPSDEEARFRIEEALPYLSLVRNTSTFWMMRIILQDLYGWKEPVTQENWRRLDSIIRDVADDRGRQRSILDRLNIRKTATEIARRGLGEDDELLQYALEWGFFTRCQWGEFDTALYELERCWGKTPESPSPIGSGQRPRTDRTIASLDDVHAAVDHYVANIPYGQITAAATHMSTDIDYRLVTADEMEEALSRRSEAGPRERDIYASYVNEAYLSALEKEHSGDIVLQFSFGAEPLPYETSSRLSQRTVAQLGEIIGRHQKIRFQCFLASCHYNQSLCTLARELPNLSLAGYWWHNTYPGAIRRIIGERLDMLPVNRQVGFFSDAYCLEWTYGKLILVRKQMARVLAEKVQQGQYSVDEAVGIAHSILYESPQTLLGLTPRAGGTGKAPHREILPGADL